MNLSSWMQETVTIQRCNGVSNFGDLSFAAQTTISAYVEYGSQLVYSTDGSEKQSTVAIASHDEIKLSDRIWIPGDNTASTSAARRPITVSRARLPGSNKTLYEARL